MTKQLIELKIPKGTKCKSGICEQDLVVETEVELPEAPKITSSVSALPEIKTINESKPSTQTTEAATAAKLTPEIKPETVLESHIPSYKCKNGNCGLHKNKNYSELAKGVCQNCGQFQKSDSGICTWCGKEEIEALEDEHLAELGIPMPEEPSSDDHDHGMD